MLTEDFDYHLPEGAVAQHPVEPRDSARLLVDRGPGQQPEDRVVRDLPALLHHGDLLVVNTSRVLPARLRLRKPTGGAVEVLLVEPVDAGEVDAWDALVRPSRRVAPGTRLEGADGLEIEVAGPGREDGTRRVYLSAPDGDVIGALAGQGEVPLPPYITEPLADPERYQTVYGRRPVAVAAPTAGLHLTPGVLDACRAAGVGYAEVELAVGLGTFRPMTAEKVRDHEMHAERLRVPPGTLAACEETRRAGGRVVAVGTTAVRALESAAGGHTGERTELFIHRPYDWQVVDVLLTNFHLPRSSLLVLVDAFIGPRWRDLYEHALAEGYRFLSFGDAMLLERGTEVSRSVSDTNRDADERRSTGRERG